MPPNISAEEIKNDLSINFKVHEVQQFIKNVEHGDVKSEVKLPIYSMEFKPGTQLKDVFT